uniref:Uncharacterized protein n=1 Tax=Ditylenchus dipsaci TaxID=166011 RepID=A0A915EFD9_9BILA
MHNFEKCVKESLVKSNSVTFTKTESIGSKQESSIAKNLINGEGVRFAPPNHSPSQISIDEADLATPSGTTALPKFSFPTLPPPDKTLRTLVDLLFPHLRQQNSSLTSSSINATRGSNLVAERRLRIELRDKLKEAKAKMESEKQRLADLTSSTQPETTTTHEPATASTTVEVSASSPSQLDSLIVKTQQKEDDKHSKTKKRRKHVLASNYKKTVTNIFCSQHFECQEVFREYVKRCEDRYKEPAEKHGIDDYHFRKLFEQNSKIHRITWLHCEESRIAGNFTDQELQKCESIKLLNLLSTVIQSEEHGLQRGEKNYQKCVSRSEKLQEKCEELKGCCPNSTECDQYNESREAKKYSEILVQLKEEQNLCEARHLRIRNGIMT